MRILIKNIKKLLQTYNQQDDVLPIKGSDMASMNYLEDAFLIIKDKKIESFGTNYTTIAEQNFDEIIDAQHGLVMPSYIDSHTHLVHATTREEEFADRIKGLTYAEIAAKGGGILNSAAKLAAMSEAELLEKAKVRLEKAIALGTGAIEIKSGYGLSFEGEIKMLRVIKALKEISPIPIKASFLGAHAFPMPFKENHQGYIDMIIKEILPEIHKQALADYIDVFCEEGFFSVTETAQLLEAGAKYGLRPKIHANQLNRSGGVQIGVQYDALSVDHLECMGEEEIEVLKHSTTLPVLLPGAAFFLGMHYQPARAMIDAGLPLVLASDYNPGSCPSFNMNFIQSLACTQMKMTPMEALHASTINAAFAIELEQEVGIIKVGHKANISILNGIANEALIPYHYGENLISRVLY